MYLDNRLQSPLTASITNSVILASNNIRKNFFWVAVDYQKLASCPKALSGRVNISNLGTFKTFDKLDVISAPSFDYLELMDTTNSLWLERHDLCNIVSSFWIKWRRFSVYSSAFGVKDICVQNLFTILIEKRYWLWLFLKIVPVFINFQFAYVSLFVNRAGICIPLICKSFS